MARITKEEVFQAASLLNEKGVKPSSNKVREILGKGSFSTISSWLSEWSDPVSELVETPALPEDLMPAFCLLWAACFKQSESMFADTFQAMNGENDGLKLENSSLITQIEEMEKELENKELDVALISSVRDTISKLQSELNAVNGLYSVLEARILEQVAHIDTLKQQLKNGPDIYRDGDLRIQYDTLKTQYFDLIEEQEQLKRVIVGNPEPLKVVGKKNAKANKGPGWQDLLKHEADKVVEDCADSNVDHRTIQIF